MELHKDENKMMVNFYSSIENASTDASPFREGFLEEAIEAERRDGDEIASPLVKVLTMFCLTLHIALEMKVTFTPNPRVRLLSFCLRMIRSIQETALASQTEIIRTYIDLTEMERGWGC